MVSMRIPYTGPLPKPRVIPADAGSFEVAKDALISFLTAGQGRTVLLTGAGISVASGLNDYRGPTGTYMVNKTYRPIYYHEFASSHEARKRYWARSFLGWANLDSAKPNAAHFAVKRLGDLGLVNHVITQNVDSLHTKCHPNLPTTTLHGSLSHATCVTCHTHFPRTSFQQASTQLNPAWASLLTQLLASGALTTDDPRQQLTRGLKTNPDGDVDLPGVSYGTFRYPACPTCLATPPDGKHVDVDDDGAWLPSSTAGILKPGVVMFGEAVSTQAKDEAEKAVENANRVLVVGSSLATYSAWRLVKSAVGAGSKIGIVNLGGVRGEESLVSESAIDVRIEQDLQTILPAVADVMEKNATSSQV